MSDMNAIMLVMGRIVYSVVMAMLVTGSIYICFDLIFGDRGNLKFTAMIENSALLLVVVIASMIFINSPQLNKILKTTVAVSLSAASIFAFIKWPMRIDDKNNPGFWVIFIIIYTLVLMFVLKEFGF